jgi:GMP synthase (glutamine-hydrolysing)
MTSFNVEKFVGEQVTRIREIIGEERALIACSGGVDSTTCAVLTHRAIGNRLLCIFLDTNFMRINEPKEAVGLLSSPPLSLPVRLIDVRDKFMDGLKGLSDAEEKRKTFREIFYSVLGSVAESENCRYLVQGTIAPDWIETKGGIKTQHNVLTQIGINTVERYGFQVIEPLAFLYKDQVREVARYLNVPSEVSERQPFPGPGLAVRVVGEIRPEKLETLKRATLIIEKALSSLDAQQYFPVIIDDVVDVTPETIGMQRIVEERLKVPADWIKVEALTDRATGVKGDMRAYGKIAIVTVKNRAGNILKAPIRELIDLQTDLISTYPAFTRILYTVTERIEGIYIIPIRAIKTRDFMTAEVAPISWNELEHVAHAVLDKCPAVSCVCYDVTPKPPATIEFE